MKNIILIGFLFLSLITLSQTTGTLTDARDGKVYKTVVIGTQTWMAENLNVMIFRNGDTIPEAKTDAEWINARMEGNPSWCYSNYDSANGLKYGILYNWYAVNDTRGLSPDGCHVPSNEEWTILTDYLGGKDGAGLKMKSSSGWHSSLGRSGNGNNIVGFSGLPGGFMGAYGGFYNYDDFGYWWSSTQEDNYTAWFHLLSYLGDYVKLSSYDKSSGLSVRCIKD